MLAEVARAVWVICLVVAVPTLSLKTTRPELLRQIPRLALYLSAVLSQWALVAATLAVVEISGGNWAALGLRSARLMTLAAWAIGLAGVIVSGLGGVLFLERRGWWPAEPETVLLLMPETRKEKWWALLIVAPTAGLCEEFLYRGFLLGALSAWFHSASWGLATSSLAFGLAHTYQGSQGVARATVLGALLAVSVLCTGSLYPAMLAHFLVDATALLWLGPRFLKPPPSL